MKFSSLNMRLLEKDRWELLTDFKVSDISYSYLRGTSITVPKYFVTDLASIPGWLRSFVQRYGTHKAAVLHDWLYSICACRRKDADVLFLKALKSAEVSYFKRMLIFGTVRMLGFLHWKDQIEETKVYRTIAHSQNVAIPKFIKTKNNLRGPYGK